MRNILICFSFWTGIFLLSIAGNAFTAMFRDYPIYWSEMIPFSFAWYIWFFLTFPVVYAAKRFPVSSDKLNRLWVHIVVFLIINFVQIILASVVISSMLTWFNDGVYRNILQKTAISGSFYNLLIYSIILILVNSFRYYKDLQLERTKAMELEKQLVKSRMDFLKQQLQPHFLFNTHHSIITLMKMGDTGKAVRMMEQLSDLMRFALKENSRQEISLEEELNLLLLYMNIQEIRFEEKLVTKVSVPQELQTCLVPSMILQPIVENSIKYAVERSDGVGYIFIHAEKEGDQLVMVVKDQSDVNPDEILLHKGIGLANTEERLQKLYPGKSRFIAQHYEQENKKGLK